MKESRGRVGSDAER